MTKLNRREVLGIAGALGLPLAPARAFQNAPEFPNPDLANIYEYLNWVGGENSPRMSFLETRWKSLQDWKRAARPVYRAHLSYDPKPVPLSCEVLSREERDGFTIEKVRISATPAYNIPARVLVPSNRKGRVPGIMAMHCHSGRYVWGHEKVISAANDHPALTAFRNRAYGRPYAELLAKRGYVVVVPDAFYFGERRLRPEDIDPATAPGEMRDSLKSLRTMETGTVEWMDAVNSLCGRYEQITAKTIFSAGASWPGILAWDDMRAVDYLCSRSDVDTKRIGCLGLSIGGLRTARLVAADARIKMACVTGWMTEFRSQLRNHLRVHTWMAYIPGLQSSLDLPDEVALTAPGALLVQQCARDPLYPMSGMKGSVEKLSKIYAKAGIPEKFRGTFYDVPHSFGPDMQDEAFAWIEKWI